MDISQVNAGRDTSLAWGTTYKDAETDDFAIFLDKDDASPEPVEKSRSRDTDDRYEKEDVADNDVDDPDHEENDLAADSSKASTSTQDPENKIVLAMVDGATQKQTTSVSAGNTGDTLQSTTQNTAPIASADTKSSNSQNPIDQLQQTTGNSKSQGQGEATANIGAGSETAAQAKVTNQSGSKNAASADDISKILPDVAKSPVHTQQTGNAQQNVATTADPSATKIATNQAKPVETAQVAATSSQVIELQEKNSGQVANSSQSSALEKLRAAETASMSEKEVLSSKISEMLRDTKGKISLVSSSKTAAPNSSPLISGQNTVTSSASSVNAQMASTTAIGTVTEAAQQAEVPFSLQPPVNTAAPVTQSTTTDPSVNGNSSIQGAAVPGVEASSSNSASQANMAARASTQAGSPAEQVSTQISAAVKEGVDKIKITLNPAELGRVDIKLELGHDGRIMAVIAADNQDSLDLLKQDSRMLEKALQDAGFETGSNSLSFSLNQQNERDEGFQTAENGSTLSDDEGDLEAIPTPLLGQAYAQSSTSSLDIQV